LADPQPAGVASAALTIKWFGARLAIGTAFFATSPARARHMPSPDALTTSINDTAGACSAYRADGWWVL
jgi:hypothetical protein